MGTAVHVVGAPQPSASQKARPGHPAGGGDAAHAGSAVEGAAAHWGEHAHGPSEATATTALAAAQGPAYVRPSQPQTGEVSGGHCVGTGRQRASTEAPQPATQRVPDGQSPSSVHGAQASVLSGTGPQLSRHLPRPSAPITHRQDAAHSEHPEHAGGGVW